VFSRTKRPFFSWTLTKSAKGCCDEIYVANASNVKITKATTFLIGAAVMSSLDGINTGHSTGTSASGIKLGRALETYLVRHSPDTIQADEDVLDVTRSTNDAILALAADMDSIHEDLMTLPTAPVAAGPAGSGADLAAFKPAQNALMSKVQQLVATAAERPMKQILCCTRGKATPSVPSVPAMRLEPRMKHVVKPWEN
jgi:hypothetical protein